MSEDRIHGLSDGYGEDDYQGDGPPDLGEEDDCRGKKFVITVRARISQPLL